MIIYMVQTLNLFVKLKIEVKFDETKFIATRNEEFGYIKLTPRDNEEER